MKIKQFYIQEWRLFKARYFKIFIVIFILFVIAMAFSHVFLVHHPDQAQKSFNNLGERILKEGPFTGFVGCLKLFLFNSLATVVGILLGLIPFLFIPALGSMLSGFYGGVVTSVSHLLGFNAISMLLFGIIPHGILEIPASLYASSLGVYVCLNISKRIFRGHRIQEKLLLDHQESDEPLSPLLWQIFGTWIGVIVPLLIIAAIIEAFITPLTLNLIMEIPK